MTFNYMNLGALVIGLVLGAWIGYDKGRETGSRITIAALWGQFYKAIEEARLNIRKEYSDGYNKAAARSKDNVGGGSA